MSAVEKARLNGAASSGRFAYVPGLMKRLWMDFQGWGLSHNNDFKKRKSPGKSGHL